MSQALCLVDRATHAGSSRYVPCERCQYRALSSPFSRGRSIIPHSPSLCTVRFSFSPTSGRLSTLSPCPSYWTPPFPLPPFFFCEHGRPHACLVERTPSPLLSFIFSPTARVGSAPCSTLSLQYEPPVYPILAGSPSGVLRPTSIRHYKIPFVLALLLHPQSPRTQSRAMKPSHHWGARFVSLR